jgi:dihydrofolate synthase/folylpolyglutamate synthase
MRYAEALAFLRDREQFHVKVGTRNIRLLAKALGHPERRFPSVVVAGTNGKGSTVAILDSILRAHGLRTGRFTSPHLVSISERILVNGAQLPDDEFAGLIGDIAQAAEHLPRDQQPSFFETITGAAFLAFARHEVDAAVFEVGMGGRWDATTATDAPLGLVTRIALDHERYLGRTVREIAGEKGAIARPGGELLIARQDAGAAEVLAASARDRGARFREVAREVTTDWTVQRTGAAGALSTPEATYDDLWLPLPGRHQLDNLALAVRGAERLFAREGLGALDPDRVRQGVSAVRWPGRLEWLPANGARPRLLLDAAHNPSGAARLAEYLDSLGRNGRRVLVFGASRDKRVAEMLTPLAPHFQRVLLTTAATRRALPIEDLLLTADRVFSRNGTRAEAVEQVPEALTEAFRLAGPKGEVVIAGSIFLLGDALRVLRAEPADRLGDDVIEMPVLPGEPAGQAGTERRSSAA